MAQRLRGSLVDTVTLEEIVFQYEPKLKDRVTSKYARQHIVGRRLANATWVGSGEFSIDIDIYLQGADNVQSIVEQLRELTLPQTDTHAPHPVYVNIGSLYVGRQFLLLEIDTSFLVFEYADSMRPTDSKVRLKLDEIPIDNGSGVIG